MSDQTNKRNDKINKAVKDIGYCCPYAFFTLNSTKRDTNKRLGNKLGLSESTMEFNKRRLRNGELKCQGCEDCNLPDKA